MLLTTVVFDFGSVLAWPPSTESCHALAAAAGMPAETLMERYYPRRAAFDRGAVTAVHYWKEVTVGFPAAEDDGTIRRLVELDVEIWAEPNLAVMGWLPQLKAAGFRIAILSNMPVESADRLEAQVEWLQLFDHRIFSGKVGMNKPEPGIYRLLLEELGCSGNPADVLFLDDLPANIAAARGAGIQAELYSVFSGSLVEIARRHDLPAPVEPPVSEARLRDTRCAPHLHM